MAKNDSWNAYLNDASSWKIENLKNKVNFLVQRKWKILSNKNYAPKYVLFFVSLFKRFAPGAGPKSIKLLVKHYET